MNVECKISLKYTAICKIMQFITFTYISKYTEYLVLGTSTFTKY